MKNSKRNKSSRTIVFGIALALSASLFGISVPTAYANAGSQIEQTKKVVDSSAEYSDKTVKSDVNDRIMKASLNDLDRNIIVAINEYRKNPSNDNGNTLKALLAQSYDIDTDADIRKLHDYESRREQYISRWTEDMEYGIMPMFVEVQSVIDPTSDERETAKKAVEKYWADKSETSRIEAVKSINAYFDAFINNLENEINDEKEHRDEYIDNAPNLFTKERHPFGLYE